MLLKRGHFQSGKVIDVQEVEKAYQSHNPDRSSRYLQVLLNRYTFLRGVVVRGCFGQCALKTRRRRDMMNAAWTCVDHDDLSACFDAHNHLIPPMKTTTVARKRNRDDDQELE